MALKAVVDSLEAVPEAVRGEYEAKDGKFILKVDGAEDAFASGLKRNRDEILTEKQQLTEQLKAFKGLNLPPEELKKLVDAASKADEEKQKAAGNFDTLKTQLISQHQAQLTEKDTAITGLTSTIESLMVDAVATQACADQKGEAILLLPHIKAHTKVVKGDNGQFATVVLDAKGNARLAGDGSGNPMTIAQLVTELKADPKFGRAFDGSGASGSGAGKSSGAGGAGKARTRADLKSVADKTAFIAEHGLEAFKALPEK